MLCACNACGIVSTSHDTKEVHCDTGLSLGKHFIEILNIFKNVTTSICPNMIEISGLREGDIQIHDMIVRKIILDYNPGDYYSKEI